MIIFFGEFFTWYAPIYIYLYMRVYLLAILWLICVGVDWPTMMSW